jgi:signal transduction histidine kinase
MMKFADLFSIGQFVQAMQHDTLWAWGTIALSLVVAVGYCVIAVNWYFQLKLSKHAQAKAALARLRNICLSCGICGYAIYAADAPWVLWRVYDGALIAVALYTWTFVLRMRGLSLVCERLAQVEELERSVTKYREIAELLPQIVWTAGPGGEIDFSNQSWRSYASDGRTWLDAIHPEDRDRALAEWRKTVAARRPITLEVRLGTNGGVGAAGAELGYRTFIVNATPIIHGDEVKWLGACADIEDQKLLAAEKDKQAKEKTFFLNALSHDLRAPLHTVLLNAHFLKMSATQRNDLESLESLDMIVQNASAAGDLVTKLLELAKAGAQDVNVVEPISVKAMLRHVAARFQASSAQKGLYVRLTGHEPVTVWTDRHKLERIVTNLVDNAIKYTNDGGVCLAWDVLDDGQTSIRVSDTGPGVPRETVPFLFDEFYQVNNRERDRTKGFGMGLAICRCLASQLDADVRLASTSPDGSCFQVSVPNLSPDRGRRPDRQESDHADLQEAGLCSV